VSERFDDSAAAKVCPLQSIFRTVHRPKSARCLYNDGEFYAVPVLPQPERHAGFSDEVLPRERQLDDEVIGHDAKEICNDAKLGLLIYEADLTNLCSYSELKSLLFNLGRSGAQRGL